MTTVVNKEQAPELATEEWLAIRKEAGFRIDPATAKVTWWWARVMDPYGVLPHCPEADCVGRQYFARSPDGDVWVSFHDIPQATVDALRERADAIDDDHDLPF
ncbi:hypothetical protein [Bradyrhizobium sp. URHD0069]|uniref:hypothetical protein n=1 Tax=Bradyrhizobium sp. URHD0069 TaxID=1380355 RepID=UPI0004962574|nr:hypothetical protein [Bradyrhizobium sp. URHD0069]